MADVLLSVEGLQAHYSSAQVLHNVTFSMGKESVAIVGRNGMGKTTLCNAIMGFTPPRASGSVRFEGKELIGQAVAQDRARGAGLRPAGPASLPLADGARASRDRSEEGRRVDCGPRLRVLSPARRAEAERRRRALRRRAADAGDRPGAARQSAAPDHGRALRGARTRDRRHDGRRVQEAGGGRSRDPADRAEARRGDVARRPPARDGRRRDRARDDQPPSSSATPRCSGDTSASSLWLTREGGSAARTPRPRYGAPARRHAAAPTTPIRISSSSARATATTRSTP